MAMEVCFQGCRSARASVLQSRSPFFSKEKVNNLQSCKAIPMAMVKLSASTSAHSFNNKCRPSRVICKAAVNEVKVVNEKTWEELVTGNSTTVLVEFWAPWCGPCRMIAPVVDELAKEYAGKAQMFKLNTDEAPAIASQYGIRSIPTVVFFKNGEKKESVIGAVPKTTLSAALDKYVDS